ncbi:MAG: hypothetical protein WC956_01415 [bacterium]
MDMQLKLVEIAAAADKGNAGSALDKLIDAVPNMRIPQISAGDPSLIKTDTLVLGPVVGYNANTFTGPANLGVGAQIGFGRIFSLDTPDFILPVYSEYMAEYRHFFSLGGSSERIGFNWTMPSWRLFGLKDKIQIRMPLTFGAFFQIGKTNEHTEQVTSTTTVPTYTGPFEPQQYSTVTTTSEQKVAESFKAGGVKALIGIDVVPYTPSLPMCLSFHAGPELGGGVRDGSARFWLAGAVDATLTFAIY